MWRVFLLLGVHQENLRWCLQSFEWISIRTQVSLRVSLGFPHWLGDGPTCSQTDHNGSHGAPVQVIRDRSYSEGRPECPPKVWFSPEIDASKFTLSLLSHIPGGSQWLKYILRMWQKYPMNQQAIRLILGFCSDSKVSSCSLPDQQLASKKVPRITKYQEVIDISII